MKTISRIIIILLVASLVAGGFYLALNNNSSTSAPGERGQPTGITNANGPSFEPMQRPDGDRDGGSSSGVAGIFGTLIKLGSIVFLIVLLEKGFNQLRNRKLLSIY